MRQQAQPTNAPPREGGPTNAPTGGHTCPLGPSLHTQPAPNDLLFRLQFFLSLKRNEFRPTISG